MCGICGWVGTGEIDRAILNKMTRALTHRGPDHQDTHVRGHVGLGHTRLSIIDLSPLGNQPMHSDDGAVSITYNGEFYDFENYRKELIAQGHTFRSHCDTEVIIHLYLRDGISFVDKLRGMFALAIWDSRSQELLLVRDRVGKKPLYYSHVGTDFVFASELKSLVCHPKVSRSIDANALDTYFRLGYIPKSDSIFSTVKKLEPGHYLRFRNGRIDVREYWSIPAASQELTDISWNDASATLSQLLSESVALRLVSDVPVGVLLSGGTDSSLVATLAARQSAERLKTFSIGFDEQRFNELPYARQIAKHIGSEHHEHIVRLDETELIASLAPYFDEPFADPSLLPTFMVSKMARQHVKVVLSGDGGDELFGGYNWYSWVIRHQRFAIIPRLFRQLVAKAASLSVHSYPGQHFLASLALNEFECFLERTSVFYDGDIDQVLASDARAQAMDRYEEHYRSSGSDTLSRLSRTDFNYYLPDDILTKVDRASMAVSLEARVPLLDQRLCEFAFKLPSKFKIANGQRKLLLRNVAKSILPANFDFDRKQGFVIPLKSWMAGKMGTQLADLLAADDYDGLLNKSGINKLLKAHRTGAKDHAMKLWSVLMFCHWKRAVDAM